MDKNGLRMSNEFRLTIEERLSQFLEDKGFRLHDHFSLDKGNKSIAIYVSQKLKLYFYRSIRDGEVNCLVGKPDADIDKLKEGGWYYLNSLIPGQTDLSIEELLTNVPEVPENEDKQWSNIAYNLENYIDSITIHMYT